MSTGSPGAYCGKNVPSDDANVAQPGDTGGIDVELAAYLAHLPSDDPVVRRRQNTPKMAMIHQMDGPMAARAARSTTIAGSDRIVPASQFDVVSNQPPR